MASIVACGSNRVMTITNINKTDVFTPKFPAQYPNSLNCTWSIVAKETELIELTLDDNGYELEEKYII